MRKAHIECIWSAFPQTAYIKKRTVREYANPIYDIKHSTKKNFPRKKDEWIGIEVPAIVSREVFDRVQERFARNKRKYRNPIQVHCGILSNPAASLKSETGAIACEDRRNSRRNNTIHPSHSCSKPNRCTCAG